MGLTFLKYYFGTGCIAWVAAVAYRRWRPSDVASVRFEAGKPTSLKMTLANVVLIPLAIAFFFLPLWPLLLSIEFGFPWHKFKFWPDKVAREVPLTFTDDEPAFVVAKADLLERLSRSAIEERERVDDPLRAVPEAPFGYLHHVWQKFINGLGPECELWSFRGRWITHYRDDEMQGYVARRGEKLGPHFLTAQRSRQEV